MRSQTRSQQKIRFRMKLPVTMWVADLRPRYQYVPVLIYYDGQHILGKCMVTFWGNYWNGCDDRSDLSIYAYV